MAPPYNCQVFRLLSIIPGRASRKIMWLSWFSKKIQTSAIWSKILRCICCSFWVGSQLSLCAKAACKCFIIDDPLWTDLVNKSKTARKKTQSMTLAMSSLAVKNNLNLKQSLVDWLSLLSHHSWNPQDGPVRQAATLSLTGLPLLPGEQQELFTEPIISSATQYQT